MHLFTSKSSQLAAPGQALPHHIDRVLYGLFALCGQRRRTIRYQHRDRLVSFGDQDFLTAFRKRNS